MIISHKYKFIFVRTRKTAGTSTEIALSNNLGPGDIVTPIAEEHIRASLGFGRPRNYRKPWHRYSLKDIYVFYKLRHPVWNFWNHIGAKQIRERVGEDIWHSYYKFALERNPWDKVASQYYHYMRKPERNLSFRDYVVDGRAYNGSDFDLYCIDGRVAVDKVILYDRLNEGLEDVRRVLGLEATIDISNIHAKGNRRSEHAGDYRDLYDDETRRLIEIYYAREIALFGFSF